MRRRQLLATALAFPALRAAAQPAAPEVLARFPNGTFLENLVVGPDGRVLFTNYTGRRLESWADGRGHAAFAEVPAHPVSLTALGDGRHALVVHGVPFTAGPAAMRGAAAVLLLNPDGAVAARIALPDAIFPNGGLLLSPGRLLVADSALGRVWEVGPADGAVRTWLEHPSLLPDPAQPYPGVNGLKRAGDALLLSNSARSALLRVAIAGDAPSGDPALVARMDGGVDDFVVGPDGTIYAATHATGLAVLRPGAMAPRIVPAEGLDGSTAVALSPDVRWLYALGTGGLSNGGRGEAVLARLPVPA